MPAKKAIDVLIVDDHRLVRQSLAALFDQDPAFAVVAHAGDAVSALKCLREHDFDVAILDVSMPGVGGICLTRRVLERHSRVKIIGLSGHLEAAYVSGMLRAGASGYVLKSSAYDELVSAVCAVAEGKMYLSPDVTHDVVNDYCDLLLRDTSSPLWRLSEREREVAELMAEGKSTNEIAALLSISPKTVATHRKRLMDALGVRSIAELTKLAIKQNLVTLES
jgi:DNA-binding NarL/FixJ family response regulator